jgi:hypothetical protein
MQIQHLEQCPAAGELARTHPLNGEWLRAAGTGKRLLCLRLASCNGLRSD